MGYAPGWRIRCLKCGLTRDAGEAGLIRIGAIGRSYTLGYCSRCKRLRCIVVEKTPDRGQDASKTAKQ